MSLIEPAQFTDGFVLQEHNRAIRARVRASYTPPKPTVNVEAIMSEMATLRAERDQYRDLAAQWQADNISLSTKLGLRRAETPRAPFKLTIDHIIKACCEYYSMKRTDLISVRRSREYVRPRQVAMYICKEMTPNSLPRIGRMFGDRDHTTVLHACRQITALRATDHQIDADVRTISAALCPVGILVSGDNT